MERGAFDVAVLYMLGSASACLVGLVLGSAGARGLFAGGYRASG